MKSVRRRVNLRVRARVTEILEEEGREWETDINGDNRHVKVINHTPIWEYEIAGKKYKSHAAGIVRYADVGDEADLLCDPEKPSELWYPVGGADYAFAARGIVLGVAVIIISVFGFGLR